MTTGPMSRPNGNLTLDWQHTDGKAWTRLVDAYDPVENVTKIAMLSWDTVGLTWVKFTGGGSGGGGAVSVADGADVTQGAKADAAWDGAAASPTVVAILKRLGALLGGALTTSVNNFPATQPVSGTVTANIGTSGALALDATVSGVAKDGAAVTGQTLEAGGSSVAGWLSSLRKAITDRIGTLGQKVMASSTPVTIASDQSAVPVSGSVSVTGTTVVDARRGQTLLFASVDVATAGDNTIVALDATRKIKVVSYVLVADAAVAVRWKSGAGTNLTGAMSFAANSGAALAGTPAAWLLETATNTALVLNLGAAVGVRGHICYFLET